MLQTSRVDDYNQFDALRRLLKWEITSDSIPVNSAVNRIIEELITIVEQLQRKVDGTSE